MLRRVLCRIRQFLGLGGHDWVITDREATGVWVCTRCGREQPDRHNQLNFSTRQDEDRGRADDLVVVG